jgi:hypothetical protein
MSARKTPASKAKPGPSGSVPAGAKASPKVSAPRPARPKPAPPKPLAPKPQPSRPPEPKIVVYKVRDDTTTMRSARGSWFIGTLSKGDHFYHHPSDPTREGNWVWGFTPHRYGCLKGFGWVSLDDLELLSQKPPNLDETVQRKLQTPPKPKLMGEEFTSRHAHDSHLPTPKSNAAEWKVTIKKGAIVPFYINQRDGQPVADQFHRTHPKLTSGDDGNKLKIRYLVRQNPNLMVADVGGTGKWGFILKQGDNFSVDFK